MIKVLFICHGNICRSPMAEFVLKDMVNKARMSDEFLIASAATSREEIGNDVHYGTKDVLRKHGVPFSRRGAVQVTDADFDKYDYIIGMDGYNMRNVGRIFSGKNMEGKVYKLLEFAGSGADVADPWYTGNFDVTYRDVVAGCEGFLAYLKEEGRI